MGTIGDGLRTWAATMVLAVMVQLWPAGLVEAGDRAPRLEKAFASVVAVLPEWPSGQPRPREPEGSGVVIGDGSHVLTADHVIGKARTIRVRTPDGWVVDAMVAGRDPFTDLAVLRIERILPALAFGPDVAVGDDVCALGHPFGFGPAAACGIVSGVHKSGAGFNPIEDFVQTDAAVNPGMSGGALIDEDGRLVGLLSGIFTAGADGSLGVNFAVAAPLAERISADLIADGRVKRVSAGMRLAPAIRKGETGRLAARVVNVKQGSPAQGAGLRVGDRIVRAAGRAVHKPADFTSAAARLRPGDTMTVTILRDDNETTVNLVF